MATEDFEPSHLRPLHLLRDQSLQTRQNSSKARPEHYGPFIVISVGIHAAASEAHHLCLDDPGTSKNTIMVA